MSARTSEGERKIIAMAGTRFVTHVKAIFLLILVCNINPLSSQTTDEEGRCGCSCYSSTRAFSRKIFTPLLISATVGLYAVVAVFWLASLYRAMRYVNVSGLRSCIGSLNFNNDNFDDYTEIIARPRIRSQNFNIRFCSEKDRTFPME